MMGKKLLYLESAEWKLVLRYAWYIRTVRKQTTPDRDKSRDKELKDVGQLEAHNESQYDLSVVHWKNELME